MAEVAPTPESNLALIEELQGLVSADYEMPDGPEFSYPAVGQAVDDEMWKFITLALGSGVLDMGGMPYWLRKLPTDAETNQKNQMVLTVSTTTKNAQALLNGFYHRLLRDMRLDFPMPLTPTTYYVVLELNPLKARSPEGPISVQVYPNEPNTESDRQHCVLWKVPRKPNQLLSDVTIERVRPKLTPTISVNHEKDRPDPSSVLWGTRVFCHVSGLEYFAEGASSATGGPTKWTEMGVTKDWTPFTLNGSFENFGAKPEFRIKDGYVEFWGAVKRKDNGDLRTSIDVFGWATGVQMKGGYYSSTGTNGQSCRIDNIVSGSSGLRDNLAVIAPPGSKMKWFSLSGLRIPLA